MEVQIEMGCLFSSEKRGNVHFDKDVLIFRMFYVPSASKLLLLYFFIKYINHNPKKWLL